VPELNGPIALDAIEEYKPFSSGVITCSCSDDTVEELVNRDNLERRLGLAQFWQQKGLMRCLEFLREWRGKAKANAIRRVHAMAQTLLRRAKGVPWLFAGPGLQRKNARHPQNPPLAGFDRRTVEKNLDRREAVLGEKS
jgi:hypothetical protein